MINYSNHNKENTRILFLSPCLPYPLDDGLKIRAFHTIKELLEKGHNITLLCFANENDEDNIKNLKKELNINIIPVKWTDFRFYIISRVFYGIFSRYPMHIKLWYKKEFKKKLKLILSDCSFDLVYVYDRSMILYGNIIQDIPKILDSVDSQSLNSLSGLKSSEDIVHKLFWYMNYIKSKRIEKSLYYEFEYIITAAERDADQLRKFTNSKIVSIPNGVDISYFKPLNLENIPYSLTFLGTMDAFSNQQAALYFVEEIYPLLKQKFPSIKFYIIGRNPSVEILNLHDSRNVFVTGYVEDIRPYIDRSEIIISPLKMASGIQNKILVAMAMNKPIVSTKESIGEISKFIKDKDVIVVNDSEEFAQKIIDLFSNKVLLNKTGNNGRNIVKASYSWESLGHKVDKLIKDILG